MSHTGKSISVRRISVSDIEHAPNVGSLLAEYAAESGLPGLGGADAQWWLYHKIEDSGALSVLGAFDDDLLIGFLALVIGPRPHYPGPVASVESFFVASCERRTGAGSRLLAAAEALAIDAGAKGIFLNAAVGSRLDRLMSSKSVYRNTHKVFHRVFA